MIIPKAPTVNPVPFLNSTQTLAVGGGGEDLALLGGDGGVAVDDAGHDAAHGLNAEGQRGDVEQQQAVDLAAEDARLDSRTDGDTFIGLARKR